MAKELILNSERVERKFGSCDIDVLQSDQRIRVSSLYSTDRGKKITRTFAVVHFSAVAHVLFAEEHREIMDGQSIGAVFKRNGWYIEKLPVFFGHVPASADFAPVYALMGGIPPVRLAIHIYKLIVEKRAVRFRYGTLAEVHHPGYLTLSALREAYERGDHRRQSGHVRKMLDVVQNIMKGV